MATSTIVPAAISMPSPADIHSIAWHSVCCAVPFCGDGDGNDNAKKGEKFSSAWKVWPQKGLWWESENESENESEDESENENKSENESEDEWNK